VNHISDASTEYLDFLARGDESPFATMFLSLGSVFPEGVTEADLAVMFRPRPGLPLTPATLGDGSRRLMWTTFTPHQIDIDVFDPEARAYLRRVLDRLVAAGVAQVRLDAVGYAVKTPGTTCFMTDETYEFIDELMAEGRERETSMLVEIHGTHEMQRRVADRVDRVYDFALPALVLHALFEGTSGPLRRWLERSPRNAITVLDTHDGIGMVDIAPGPDHAGLLADAEIDGLVESIHDATAGESRLATGAAASNLDLYQINSSYYSALGCDDDRYVTARGIQLFSPGIPQIYYGGLLAARNDMTLLERTGVGRDINRTHFDRDDIERELNRPVVRRLLELVRFRNRHRAFDGTFTLVPGDDAVLGMRWDHGDEYAELVVDLARASFDIRSSS
jgi:sucrose phosphorylase